jgi:hypothetical protein
VNVSALAARAAQVAHQLHLAADDLNASLRDVEAILSARYGHAVVARARVTHNPPAVRGRAPRIEGWFLFADGRLQWANERQRVPLTSAARAVRIAAVGVFPALLEALERSPMMERILTREHRSCSACGAHGMHIRVKLAHHPSNARWDETGGWECEGCGSVTTDTAARIRREQAQKDVARRVQRQAKAASGARRR